MTKSANDRSTPKKVAVFGAGVAGLTAAHELADRGFDVTVYEKSGTWGGKARSTRATGERTTPNLPGEHGFHFVPGFYRHVPDTMARIPIGAPPTRRTVADCLVACTRTLVARETLLPDLDFPNRIYSLEDLLQLRRAIRGLGLPLPEIPYFMNRVRILATSCDARYDEELEGQTWWDFIGADTPFLGFDTRSNVYKTYLAQVPVRSLVAMSPRLASARTVGRTAMRMWAGLLYPVNVGTQSSNVMVDRVLNRPTNEAWFNPWIAFLSQNNRAIPESADTPSLVRKDGTRRYTAMTVRFVQQAEVTRVGAVNGRIEHVMVKRWGETVRIVEDAAQRVRDSQIPAAPEQKAVSKPKAKAVAMMGDPRRSSDLPDGPDDREVQWARTRVASMGSGSDASSGHRDRWLDEALRAPDDSAFLDVVNKKSGGASPDGSHRSEEKIENFDYYLFALPMPIMAGLIEGNPALQVDSALRRLPLLRPSTSWMIGLQFFLRRDVSVARGHVILVDSPWALTAISQAQFWESDVLKDGTVKGVISVIISDWDACGDVLHKKARECSRDEIKHEVWTELKSHLNDAANGTVVLRDDDLVDWSLADSLTEVAEGDARPEQGKDTVTLNSNGLVWQNSDELFINTVGSLKNRPTACTSFPNMFLAGDYVRTNADLATMESANEAARRAVNGILEIEGFAHEEMCKIWPLDLDLPKALEVAHEKATALDAIRYNVERTYARTRSK